MSIRLMTLIWDIPFPAQSQKLIALKLADYAADTGGSVFPAVNTVAKQAGCDERTVQRVLKAFRKCGLIELVREGGTGPKATNEWRLNVPLIASLSSGESTITGSAAELEIDVNVMGDIKGGNLPGVDGLRVTNDALRVTPVSAKGDTGVTQPFTNHHIDTSSCASAPATRGAARSALEGTGTPSLVLPGDHTWQLWLNWLRQEGHTKAAEKFEAEGAMVVFIPRPLSVSPMPKLAPLRTSEKFSELMARREAPVGKMAAAGSDA